MNESYPELSRKFSELQAVLARQGRVSEAFSAGFVLSDSGPSHSIDLLVMTLVHGNEAGSLLPVCRLLEEYAAGRTIEGRIGILLCNPEAAAANVRFLEKDMNRCFGIGDSQSLEGRKAQALEPLILRSRLLVDLHQTNYETKSDFFIFPESKLNIAFASQLCGETPIITHGLDFSNDGYTSDTFASMNGITSITYEMGQIGKSADQAEKTLKLLKRAVGLARIGLRPSAVPPNILQFGQKVTASAQKRLIPNLINMAKVMKGEVLGHDDASGPIVAQHDGYVLFPKYGANAEKSSELCQLVKIDSGIPDLRGR